MATGPVTSDGVPLDVLRTKIQRFLPEYNVNGIPTLKSLLTEDTWQETLQVDQNPKTFERAGQDTAEIPMQRLTHQNITMPTPHKRVLGSGVTQDALHFGLTAAQVMEEWESCRDAHTRFLNQWVMRAALLDGGWWDATATPPRYANNVMASSHDHYLAYNASGVLSLTACNRTYRTLQEHGYGIDPVLFVNGNNLELTSNLADWSTEIQAMTPAMESLQQAGFKALRRAGGLTIVQNDYCPVNYCWATDLGASKKPIAWRERTLPTVATGLQMYEDGPNAQWYQRREFVSWAGAAVQVRGAGVAIYLGAAQWTDPTVAEWS